MSMPIYSAEFRRRILEVFILGQNNVPKIKGAGLRMRLAMVNGGAQCTFFVVDVDGNELVEIGRVHMQDGNDVTVLDIDQSFNLTLGLP